MNYNFELNFFKLNDNLNIKIINNADDFKNSSKLNVINYMPSEEDLKLVDRKNVYISSEKINNLETIIDKFCKNEIDDYKFGNLLSNNNFSAMFSNKIKLPGFYYKNAVVDFENYPAEVITFEYAFSLYIVFCEKIKILKSALTKLNIDYVCNFNALEFCNYSQLLECIEVFRSEVVNFPKFEEDIFYEKNYNNEILIIVKNMKPNLIDSTIFKNITLAKNEAFDLLFVDEKFFFEEKIKSGKISFVNSNQEIYDKIKYYNAVMVINDGEILNYPEVYATYNSLMNDENLIATCFSKSFIRWPGYTTPAGFKFNKARQVKIDNENLLSSDSWLIKNVNDFADIGNFMEKYEYKKQNEYIVNFQFLNQIIDLSNITKYSDLNESNLIEGEMEQFISLLVNLESDSHLDIPYSANFMRNYLELLDVADDLYRCQRIANSNFIEVSSKNKELQQNLLNLEHENKKLVNFINGSKNRRVNKIFKIID